MFVTVEGLVAAVLGAAVVVGILVVHSLLQEGREAKNEAAAKAEGRGEGQPCNGCLLSRRQAGLMATKHAGDSSARLTPGSPETSAPFRRTIEQLANECSPHAG